MEDIATGSETGDEEIWFKRSMKNALIKVLSSVVPKANPDFEGRIHNVRQWILEVDDQEGTPEREIGLDDNGKVMMIMPWRDNCGFWTDSNACVDDLAKSHEMQFVDEQEFKKLWNEFDAKNGTW